MRLHPILLAALLAGLAAPGWAQRTGTATNPFGAGAAAPPPVVSAPSAPTATTGSQAQRFREEASAQAHCPGDSVVWVNGRSGAVHAKGDRYYGKTRTGAYACQGEVPARRALGGTRQ